MPIEVLYPHLNVLSHACAHTHEVCRLHPSFMFHAYDPNSDENLNDLSIPLSAMNYDSVILLIIKVCISEHKDTQGHSMMY